MSFSLPDLPYAHDALAPYMSRETLEYHHDKHHLAYVNNGNNLAKGTEWENKPLEEIVKGTFGKNQGLFNNAGQHYNHIHFWKWMTPGGGGDKIPGELEKKITADLGSVANMKEEFIQAGVTQFGSGWCWLAVVDGKIVVMKTLNGENPLVQGGKPILGCDVWEHSYYIDYRNRRPDYLKAPTSFGPTV
jgi:superoxide dismutase, Fe-Mn family